MGNYVSLLFDKLQCDMIYNNSTVKSNIIVYQE